MGGKLLIARLAILVSGLALCALISAALAQGDINNFKEHFAVIGGTFVAVSIIGSIPSR